MAYPDTLDYSQDYKVWNERETVTYLSKTTEAVSSATTFTLTDTLWTSIDRESLETDSILSKFEYRVQIAGATFPVGNVPKENDLMIRGASPNQTQWIVRKLEGPDPVDWDVYVDQDFNFNQNAVT